MMGGNIDEIAITDDSNNDSNNLTATNKSTDNGIVVDDCSNQNNNDNNNDNDELGSDPEKYFGDNDTGNNITYYQDTIYEKVEELIQSPGEYSLFGYIKGFSRDALINKQNPNNAKFYFACEIYDDSYDKILSVKHRDIICSNKIILMICVQGEEKFRKISLICLDKDWFNMNSQTIFETSEFEDNTSSLLTSAIESSDSLVSIIPIEMRFFYPNDNEDKFQETPSNYYSELKDCYDLIYKKETQDSLHRNQSNVTAAAKLLRASVDLDCVLLHIGIELPPVLSIPVAKTYSSSLPVATTNRKPQPKVEIGGLSNENTGNNQLTKSLMKSKSKPPVGTAKPPRPLTEIMTANIMAPSVSRICPATRMKESVYVEETLPVDTTNRQKATPKTTANKRKRNNNKATPKQPALATKAAPVVKKTATAKKTAYVRQKLPIVSPSDINHILHESLQLPSNNANTTNTTNLASVNDKKSDGHRSTDVTTKAVDSNTQKIIDDLLAEKQDLAARLSAAEYRVEKTSSTILDLQQRVEYLATVKSDKESGGHKSADATFKAVDAMYSQMFNSVERQNNYDFSKSFDENKAIFGSDGSSGRQFFEHAVPLGPSNCFYNDYVNYYSNHPHASNMMNPALHSKNVNGGIQIATNTATPFNHQAASNGHMFNNHSINNHSINQSPFSSVVGSGQQHQLPLPPSHLTPNMQLYYAPSPHTSTSYNQPHQQQMSLPPITQSPAFNNHYHYHNNTTDSLRQSQANSKDLGSLILGLGFLNR